MPARLAAPLRLRTPRLRQRRDASRPVFASGGPKYGRWPIGYRVEERCEALSDALGLPAADDGVAALCAYHGCSVE